MNPVNNLSPEEVILDYLQSLPIPYYKPVELHRSTGLTRTQCYTGLYSLTSTGKVTVVKDGYRFKFTVNQ